MRRIDSVKALSIQVLRPSRFLTHQAFGRFFLLYPNAIKAHRVGGLRVGGLEDVTSTEQISHCTPDRRRNEIGSLFEDIYDARLSGEAHVEAIRTQAAYAQGWRHERYYVNYQIG